MINLNQDSIIRNIGSSAGIALPFDAPLMWWTNHRGTDPNNPEYYGCWAGKSEEFDTAEYGEMPGMYGPVSTGIGNLLSIRSFAIAPFEARYRWDKEENHGKLHQLAMVAYIKDGHAVPWGAMVLSTKSTTQKRFQQLLKEWSQTTYDARSRWANGYPAHYFWMPIGTFGPEPIIEEVSQKSNPNKKSQYTYPQTYPYKEITEEILTALFVGQEVADKMVAYKDQAFEWANDTAWKKGEEINDDAAHAAALAEVMPAPGVSSQMFTPEPFPF